jgi:hypothetical protein
MPALVDGFVISMQANGLKSTSIDSFGSENEGRCVIAKIAADAIKSRATLISSRWTSEQRLERKLRAAEKLGCLLTFIHKCQNDME